MSTKNIPQMDTNDCVTQINTNAGAKGEKTGFRVKPGMTGGRGGLSTADKISNFLGNYKRPFSVDILAEHIGMSKRTTASGLKEAVSEGKAKEIERGIYVAANRHPITEHRALKIDDYQYKLTWANKFLEAIEAKSLKSCREVGKELGISRQLAFMYLTALASIGCIGMNLNGYYVIHRKVINLGGGIKKGILGEMRLASGLPKSGRRYHK